MNNRQKRNPAGIAAAGAQLRNVLINFWIRDLVGKSWCITTNTQANRKNSIPMEKSKNAIYAQPSRIDPIQLAIREKLVVLLIAFNVRAIESHGHDKSTQAYHDSLLKRR